MTATGPVPSVLQLVAPAPIGGLERVVSALVVGLASRGRRVGVAALGVERPESHPMLAPLIDRGIEVRGIATAPRAYRRQVGVLADLRRTGAWSVVHSHGYHADLIASFVSGPRVATFHGFTRGGVRNRTYEWLQCRAARNAEAVVAVSDPIRAELERRGVAAERLHLIRNALPPDEPALESAAAREALGLGPDPVVGWVGRLTAEKGPDLFVDAIGKLVNRQATGLVLGDGPMRTGLEARARNHGIGKRIRWAGSVRDAVRYLPALDLLVLSSRTEGTPMVLLEAMRAGVPVVATSVGGIPDVVGPEEAILTEANSGRLAAGIDLVLADADAARAMASRARARFDRDFDYQRWLDQYDQLYRSIGGG